MMTTTAKDVRRTVRRVKRQAHREYLRILPALRWAAEGVK